MSTNDGNDGPRTLKTVSVAADVVEAVRERGSVGVTELAEYLDLSKSTAYIHLKTLEENGFLVRRDGAYEIAFKFFVLGEYARNRSPLYQYGKPEVDELAEETGQYTHIVTEENGYGINLYQVKGETSISDDYQSEKPQHRDHLHYTASGKAILAYLPRERVEDIVASHGLPAHTEHTITDPDELFEELAAIRERGYAYNDGEEIEGFRAIGAPIRNPEGEVLGSLSVSGPASFMRDERFRDDLPERVTRAANVIEVSLNMNSHA
ncbi:IclR family transcriptional regulator (plasmid) [Halarchaeum sp. CBA1220]|uniref:IclR family transcriptional regulator n=1 Tax=Halarchaeum sp. CBA1220 TaxID=1853682 RepID=UPI000F3A96F3|nr:IclR family transcriptional regulator [Halarchaeum sp. CBA1220]QLC35328.1 IclR family transcriptional regulator [Halarchaeum sp. CBA1220]